MVFCRYATVIIFFFAALAGLFLKLAFMRYSSFRRAVQGPLALKQMEARKLKPMTLGFRVLEHSLPVVPIIR